MVVKAVSYTHLEEAQKEMMTVMKNQNLTDEQRFSQWTNILKGLTNDAVAKQDEAKQDVYKRQINSNKNNDI